METVDCPACGMRFTHPRPNVCTACDRTHCRNCLKVFRDEMEDDLEGRFIVLCPECAEAVSWRIEAQEVVPSSWKEYDGQRTMKRRLASKIRPGANFLQ